MISRIADHRITDPDKDLALAIDLLRPCSTIGDLQFMFDAAQHLVAGTYRVPVDAKRALLFEWVEGFGAVNIRLE